MSDPNQPYGAVPPPSYPPPPPGPPPAFPPPGFPPGGPPSGPPGFPPPGGPSGRGKGLLIALGILGALALVGVVVGLVLLLTGDDDGDDDADGRDTTSESTSPSDDTGTDEPTDEPTEPTDATDSTDATDASTTDAPSPQGSSTADAVADDPEAVVEAFMNSVFSGDCATAEDLVTEAYLEKEGSCDPDDIPTGFEDQVDYAVGKATITGSTAKVPVQIIFGGDKESSTVSLVQEDGHWRISQAG
jgi:hypothetical protein